VQALLPPLRAAWRENLDQPAALDKAMAILDLVRLGKCNVRTDYDPVTQAAAALWDGGRCGDSEKLTHYWRLNLQRLLKTDVDLTDQEVLSLRVSALRLSARSAYRLPDQKAAWAYIRSAYFLLRDAAGGEEALSAALAADPFSGLGQLYAELLGIAVPVAPRLPATVTAYHAALFLRDAEVVVAQLVPGKTARPEHHPLVSQLLLVVLRRGDVHRDTRLVQTLWVLDHATRPKDARGQVSVYALWAEVADFFGETESAMVYRKRAHKALVAAGLRRRARVMDAQGY
jgi:hypothetical protein